MKFENLCIYSKLKFRWWESDVHSQVADKTYIGIGPLQLNADVVDNDAMIVEVLITDVYI